MVYYAAVNHWNTKDLRKHHAEWEELDTMNASHVIIPFVSKLSHQAKQICSFGGVLVWG